MNSWVNVSPVDFKLGWDNSRSRERRSAEVRSVLAKQLTLFGAARDARAKVRKTQRHFGILLDQVGLHWTQQHGAIFHRVRLPVREHAQQYCN